jgi:cystathionine beta-lyase/cystathionine gamma-synthase
VCVRAWKKLGCCLVSLCFVHLADTIMAETNNGITISEWSDENVLQQNTANSAPSYCRSTSRQVTALCEALSNAHPGARESFVTPSGMSAISAVIQTVLKTCVQDESINLVIGDELYCDTAPLVAEWVEVLGMGKVKQWNLPIHSPVDCGLLFDQLAGSTNIVLVESCSNPSQHVFDFSLLANLKITSKRLIVIVDNTWLSHVIFNPFEVNEVDVVVTSLSKYYSGGTMIAGAILLRDAAFSNGIFRTLKLFGSHVDPSVGEKILKTLESIELRVRLASDALYDIVAKVGDISMCVPDAKFSSRYFKSYPPLAVTGCEQVARPCLPSIITFFVQKSSTATLKLFKLSGIRLATSFGGIESKLDNWPKRLEDGCCKCRLSIGFSVSDKEKTTIIEFLSKHAVKKIS